MANVKITALTNIGSNILYSALIPMVNMAGSPVTQQGNIQILGNYILSGAGSANFAPAYLSNLAYSVVNAAQPNITSVGTLTSLAVTGNVTSNSYMTANFFVGDGGLLTNVSSAGTSIANGTSNVSIPAAGGNININRGGVANVLVVTGTGVNVTGTLNATGNLTSGNLLGSHANGTSNVNMPTAGGNINMTVGGTANVLVVTGTGVNVAGTVNATGNLTSGNLTTTNLNITGNVTSNLLPNANVTYNLGSSTQRWKDIWLSNSTIYLGNSTISAGDSNSVVFSGSVQADGNITANAGSDVTISTVTGNTTHAWSFGADGNLTLPNNTFAVNYANGTPVSISGGGSANIGNFVFTSNTMRLDNAVNSNLYIQNDNTAKAQILIPSSADANTVELTLKNSGNAGVHVLTGPSAQYIWHFDITGNVNMPGNAILEGYQLFVGPGAQELPNIANATLVISSNSEAYIQSVINNVSDIGSADWIAQGHYGDDDGGYADFGFNSAAHEDPEYSLTGPGDGYILVQGYYPGQGPALGGGNLVLATGVEGTDRDIIFGTGGYTSANMFAKMSDANTALEFTRPGTNIRFGDSSLVGEVDGPGTFGILATSNSNVLIETSHFDGAFTTEYVWEFSANGTFIPPTLSVNLHNGGNQLGQVLQFGDPGYQAIITGPTPEANVNAQRLIIQGQRGNGPGSEGGDVYFWAGDANTNGGDIKIYAGDADDASAGYGGYINLDGGSGYDGGGEITLTGGSSANGIGGGVGIYSGSGTHTSNITIQSGQSSSANFVGGGIVIEGGYSLGNSGGAVSVKGGESSLGIADYGNVLVQAGASTWIFDNDGVVSASGNLKLAPDSANAGSYLDIFLTGGPDLHLVASASANLILGKDDQANVMTNWDGNVTIQSWDTNTNTQGGVWTFDGDGNLTLPGNAIAINYADGNRILGNVTFRDEIVIGTGTSNLISGLYLAPSSSSANADMYLRVRGNINDEPTHIHFDTGNNQYYNQYIGDDNKYILLANTGDIVINSNDVTGNTAQWTFGADGQLTLPGNLVITGNANVFGTNSSLLQTTDNRPLIALSSGANGAVSSLWVEDIGNVGTSNIAAVYANPTSGSKIVRIAVGQNGGGGPNLWDFGTTGNLTLPGNTVAINFANGSSAFGNIVATNLDGNVSNLLTGNGTYVAIPTVPTVGNIATLNLDGSTSNVLFGNGVFAAVPAPTVAQDITSNGAMSIMLYDGNIKYNNYATVEPSSGNIAGNNISATGNISANNFTGNGGTLSNVATKVEGSWTLASGVNTVSINVPLNGTYTIWINGNIPNGIVTYTATGVVTNTNVPVLGEQYAWYYALGNALVLTSIPDQFVGTVGSISNVNTYAGNTANVFTFGITNNSGNAAVVNYGYTKL